MQIKKDTSIEGLRGLASIIVVITHFLDAFRPAAIVGNNQVSGWEIFYTTPLSLVVAGNFAVSLFFIMSGYVLSIKHFLKNTRNSEIQGDALKRYFRLGIPLVATCFLSFMISHYNFYYNKNVADIVQNEWFANYFSQLKNKNYWVFLHDIFLKLFSRSLIYNPPSWTIKTELIGSYLTFGILVVMRQFQFRFAFYLLIFLLLSGDVLQNFILGIAIADVRVNYASKEMEFIKYNKSVFYLAIYCLFFVSIMLAGFPYYVPHGTIISSGSFYQFFIFLDNRSLLGGGITLISSFLFFLTYRHTFFRLFLETMPMQIVGKYSFMLYLTHFLSLASISSFVYIKTIGRDGEYNLLLTLGVYLSSTIFLTFATGKLVDFPAISISNKLKSFYLKKLENQTN